MNAAHHRKSGTAAAAPWQRGLAGGMALMASVVGLFLASHHPLGAAMAVVLFVMLASCLGWWPELWLLAWPVLLPLAGLAPWTGWITFEEADLLTLAVATGVFAQWALRGWQRGPRPRPAGLGWAWLLVLLWCADAALAMGRGVVDAGGWSWGWFEGYRGPMNALRLFKPTLGLCLLLPLWLQAANARSSGLPGSAHARAVDQLTLGLALSHGVVALMCLWERLAFAGLFNFSADYRTTGSFWEMHVGGAALDGFLALTLPFALQLWWTASSRRRWLLGVAITLLGSYAAITTFSRIVYLALPLGLTLMLVLRHLQASTAQAGTVQAGSRLRSPGAAMALGVLCVLASIWVFPKAGYRGMLAVLGNVALLALAGPLWAALRLREALAAVALALVGGALVGALALQGAKWPYLVYALVSLVGMGLALWAARRPSREAALVPAFTAALYLMAVACTLAVAWHWGGLPAWERAWPVGAVLTLVGLAVMASRQPLWPGDLRWQGGLTAVLAVALVVVGVFGGGAYMSSRIHAAGGDEQGRLHHWRASLWRLTDETSRWLGQGSGRYLDQFALQAEAHRRPGDMRLKPAQGTDAAAPDVVHLVAGTHVQGWGELLRLSQRVGRPEGRSVVRVDLRTADKTVVHAEVCIKHLLYDDGCQTGVLELLPKGKPGLGDWQTVSIPLGDHRLPADAWWLPRWTMFSLATESAEHALEVREISLRDEQGHELLVNRRFEQGGARWFFSSDRHHMPWHAKNMVVHLLFEQGYLGLAVMAMLGGVALWRVVLGRGRAHPLAPALAASLLGFWVVGAVDSLLDMPRVAVLFLLLCGVALSLRQVKRAPDSG
jgi:hypothetical protein